MKHIVIAVTVITLLIQQVTSTSAQTLPPGEDAIVVGITDGDTIDVLINDLPYVVRYIGVDTPETKDPSTTVQCYGPEASAINTELVTGQTLRLVRDRSNKDRYGRLLRYAYLPDGTMVNAKLVYMGAAFAKRYPPDVRHAKELAAVMAVAQAAGAGLWSACQVNGLTTAPLPAAPVATVVPVAPEPAPPPAQAAPSAPPTDAWNCPPTHPIKGNENSMIYHRPGQQAYNRTKPEACFATDADAVAAGFRAAKR